MRNGVENSEAARISSRRAIMAWRYNLMKAVLSVTGEVTVSAYREYVAYRHRSEAHHQAIVTVGPHWKLVSTKIYAGIENQVRGSVNVAVYK